MMGGMVMSGSRMPHATQAVTVLVLSALFAGCAPVVSFPVARPGLRGIGAEVGMEFGKLDFEVNLDLVGRKESAAVRRKNSAAEGGATDAELYGPVIERAMKKMLAANPAIHILSQATHTMDLAGYFYAHDAVSVKKEDIKLENRVVDVKETHTIDRIYELTLRYELRSSGTGTVLGSGKQDRVRTVSVSGRSSDDALGRFESWESILESLVSQASSKIMAEILPRLETVKRKLRKGDSKFLRESVELATREGLDRAWPLWQNLLSRKESILPKDRAALLYNAAIYYEAKDVVAEARLAFEQCFAASPDPWCHEGVARMTAREQELARMR